MTKLSHFGRVFAPLMFFGILFGVAIIAPWWWTSLAALTALGMALDG
jgi:hypothetical protein